MTSRKSLPKEFALPKWFYVVILLIVSLIIFFFLLINGQIRYLQAYIHCGWQKPILARTGLHIDGGKNTNVYYILPGEEGYYLPKDIEVYGTSTYYCTEDAAVADGYTHRNSKERP